MIKKNIFKILIIVFLFLNVNNFAKEVKVVIFHLNDIHAHIKNLAKVAEIVNEEKKTNKNVYLFNIGDNFSGNPVVDQYEPKGEPLLILYKLMKFDVLTLGNHEFDYGRKILRRFILKSNFKTICANVEDKNGWLANATPYTILKTNEGIKIALLGIIQVEKDTEIPSTHPKNVGEIIFRDELDTINKHEFLKKENDAMILLSHMGMGMDVTSAEKFGWIDLIIGGHSHTIIENPKEYNGVLITQAGAQAKYLGKIELLFNNKKLISKKGSIIDLSKVKEENKTIKKLIKEFNSNETLNKVITTLPFKITGKRQLGNMICDAMVAHQSVDMAFMNSGGIRVGKLDKKVTVKDVYTMHPFSNDIIVFYLSPNEIRALIKTSFKKGGKIDLFTGGISYSVFKSAGTKNGIKKIVLRDKKGVLLNESRKYSVAINNYIASAYKFKKEDLGKSANITLAEVVTEYLKKTKSLPEYKKIHRTKIELFIDKNTKPIGKTRTLISNKGIKSGSCSAGNLITDAFLSELKVDIAIYPSRNIKGGIKIKKNENIYFDMIPLIYNYSLKNKVVTGYMKGKDVSEFIFKIIKFRNKVELQVAGINYTIKKDNTGRVIDVICNIGNKKIDDNKVYKLAFTDYEFEKFYGIKDKVKDIKKSQRTIAKIVNDYIVKNTEITESIDEKRIHLSKKK